MHYTPIVGTLAYILSPDRSKTLLVHRSFRADDDQLGKFNGVGGKMLPTEDVVSCMRREIVEETSLQVRKMRLRGTVNWTGFGPNGEDWLGFIFLIEEFEGTPFQENAEGTLAWYELGELDSLPMWKGDRYFLPLVFDDDPRCFHGYMPYENDEPLSWSYQRI